MILKDGIPFFLATIILTGLAMWFLSPFFAIVGLLFLAFFLNFFRNPNRNVPEGEGIVSPADGKVVVVSHLHGQDDSEFEYLISIFMSPIDVHVNRSPMKGKITEYKYIKGIFKPAYDDKATLENERNLFFIQNDACRIRCSQVAGVLARRIRFWKMEGDSVERGERIGLIKFGSRVDLWLPANVEIAVKKGQRVKAGLSILANFK